MPTINLFYTKAKNSKRDMCMYIHFDRVFTDRSHLTLTCLHYKYKSHLYECSPSALLCSFLSKRDSCVFQRWVKTKTIKKKKSAGKIKGSRVYEYINAIIGDVHKNNDLDRKLIFGQMDNTITSHML